MKDDFFQKWNLLTNEMQKSLQAMMALNAKVMQSFNYLKPDDLTKQPADILSKHIAITLENSQQVINYMSNSFQILENVFLPLSKELHESSGESSYTQVRIEPERTKIRKPRAKAASKKKKAKFADISTKAAMNKEENPKRKVKASGRVAKSTKKRVTKSDLKTESKEVDISIG